MKNAALRLTVLSAAIAFPAVSFGAEITYQAAVAANGPYLHYRFNEAAPANGAAVVDASVNGRNGLYNGGAGATLASVTGAGIVSDNGVQLGGTDNEFVSTSINSFGSLIGSSSYEFLFKVNNPAAPAAIQSLLGVFTKGANLPDLNIDLNSRGNDALGALANTTRIFVRGNNGDAAGGPSWAGHFTNAALYDGGYHHLVFTFDAAQPSATAFTAYVDGVAQEIIFTQVNGTGTPGPFGDLDVLAAIGARNVRTDPITAAGVSREANVTFDEVALYGSVLSPADVLAHSAAIPEPAGLSLVGVAALGVLRRRR